MKRRDLIKTGIIGILGGGILFSINPIIKSFFKEKEPQVNLMESIYYEKLPNNVIKCKLCFRGCEVSENNRGFCKSRENINGRYYSLVYREPVAMHIDPIEKLPLKHVFPNATSLCLGTACCTFYCLYCINWHIALKSPEEVESFHKTAKEVVEIAVDNEVPIICFTYNEPTVAYEYMLDVFKIAKKEGLKTCYHSNGSMRLEPLEELLKYVDAVVVDLKAFNKDTYKKLTAGNLDHVLDYLQFAKDNIWLEIVNLIVPTYNDDMAEIRKMCNWIYDNLGCDVPLHFSRFFPTFKLEKLYPTPIKTLENAHKIAKEVGLNYVYLNNVPGHKFENTYCPKCGKVILKRKSFFVTENNIEDGRCKYCGYKIPGLWRV